MADRISFSWDADPNTDFFRLYEDGVIVADNIIVPTFDLMMVDIDTGNHDYQVEAVNQFSSEISDPVTINFTIVAKPVLAYTIV